MVSVEKTVVESWIVCKDGFGLAYRYKDRQWVWVKIGNPMRAEQSHTRRFNSEELAQERANEYGGSVRLLRWFENEPVRPQ